MRRSCWKEKVSGALERIYILLGGGGSTDTDIYIYVWGSLVAQLVRNLPAMRETWVRSLGWEDPLEKGKATYSSILAWRIPWTTVHGFAESDTRLSDFHFHIHVYMYVLIQMCT